MKDHNTLREAGVALYGPMFQLALGDALDVSDRTIRRWINGEYPIPDGIWPELAALCRDSSKALTELAAKLDAS